MEVPAQLTPIHLVLILSSASLTILCPLYVDPRAAASAWSGVTTVIAAYLNVQSDDVDSNGYPSSSNYITGLSKLNKYANVTTLGCTDALCANRAYADVTKDVNTYASWARYTHPGSNTSIGAIFFDDVPTESPASSSGNVTYYKKLSVYTYDKVPSTITSIAFNPGALGPQALFSYSDTMVEFENSVSSYQNAATIKTLSSRFVGQSAIIAYNTTFATAVKNLVYSMISYGVGQVFFDYGQCFYKESPRGFLMQVNAAGLKTLAAAVAAG